MRTVIAVTFLLFATFSHTAAQAHAHLDHAVPAAGSTVQTAPRQLVLTFTQDLEPAFSSLDVTDASGGRVDQGKPEISGNTMRVGLQLLPPGMYRVRWHVVSVDTHKTEGDFTFRVGGR